MRQLNATYIALIPKVPNPDLVKDFRPICNTIYKCISKITAERLKPLLIKIVDIFQSAFIAGINISDNIFMIQELLQGYHSLKGEDMTLKVDLMKAFDYVRWNFIIEVLRVKGFPSKFIG